MTLLDPTTPTDDRSAAAGTTSDHDAAVSSTRLHRNIGALVGSIFATAGLGALYWAIAARRYSSHDVGINASLISAMALLTNLASLNFTDVLNRFVPVSGRSTKRLVVASYAITVSLGTTAAVGFVLGVDRFAPSLSAFLRQPGYAALFVASVALWCVFVLQDAVLVGLHRAGTVLAENASFGVVKIVLLLALATALPHSGIFVSWTAPLLLIVVVVNALVFRVLLPRHADTGDAPVDRRAVRRFLVADYVSSLAWTASISLMPLVVLAVEGPRRGPSETAYVYLAWSMAYTLFLVSRNTGMVLTTEAARDPEHLDVHVRRAVGLGLRLVVPLAVLLAAAAPLVLRIYGTEYSANATTLLRLLALTMIPAAVPVYAVTIARVEQRLGAMVAITLVSTLPTLAISIPLLHVFGIVGIGWAWCIVQTTTAVFLLRGELRQYLWPRTTAGSIVTEDTAAHPVHPPAGRPRRSRPRAGLDRTETLLLLAAAGAWAWCVATLDPSRVGRYGLLDALPTTFWAALVLLVVAFAHAVRRGARTGVVVSLTAALVVVLHATPSASYTTLRYGWAWRHVGVVDLLLHHHALQPTTTVLPIYQHWPGFFAGVTAFVDAARLPDALGIAAWAPPAFALANVIALAALLRTLTTDRRRIGIAIWLFVLANWIGQEYFAPQAFDYLLYLTLLAVLLRWFRSDRASMRWEPAWMQRLQSDQPTQPALVRGPQRRAAGTAAVLIMAALATSHPLTPVVACAVLIALTVAGVLDRRWPAVTMVVLSVGWMLTGAWAYTQQNVGTLVAGFGSLGGNVDANVRDLGALSPEQQVVAAGGRLVVAVMALLALVGIIRRWRRHLLDRAGLMLCVLPLGLLVSSSYGGEVVFRTYLFTLPFLALAAATAFLPGKRSRATTPVAVAAGFVSVVLVAGFTLAYFGKESWSWFAPGEVRAAEMVATHAPTGSLLIHGTLAYPAQARNVDRFTYVSIVDEPQRSVAKVLRDPVGTLASWMSESKYRAGYLLITRSQIAETDAVGLLPKGALARVRDAVAHSARFKVLYEDADALLVTLDRGVR